MGFIIVGFFTGIVGGLFGVGGGEIFILSPDLCLWLLAASSAGDISSCLASPNRVTGRPSVTIRLASSISKLRDSWRLDSSWERPSVPWERHG